MSNSNSEILSTFRDRRRLDFENALENLDNEITILKRRKSAKHQVLSGATIKGVLDLCEATTSSLAENYLSEIRKAVDDQILASESDLASTLHKIFEDSFPDKLAFANDRLSAVVAMVGVERVLDGLVSDVSNHFESVSEKLLTDVKLIVSALRVVENKTARVKKMEAWQKLGILIALVTLTVYLFS